MGMARSVRLVPAVILTLPALWCLFEALLYFVAADFNCETCEHNAHTTGLGPALAYFAVACGLMYVAVRLAVGKLTAAIWQRTKVQLSRLAWRSASVR
jgi:hypothetical protein